MSSQLDSTLPNSSLANVVSYTGNGQSADQEKVTVGASASTDTVSVGKNNANLEDTMSGTNTPVNPIAAAVAAAAPDTKAIATVVENVLKDRDNQNAMNQHITNLVTAGEQAKAQVTASQNELTQVKATLAAREQEIATLKAEATATATKLTQTEAALATANTALTETNGKIAKIELDTAIAGRKQALAAKSVTAGKLFDRALATKENKLVMSDEDFDVALDAVQVKATETPAPTTPAPTPAPTPNTPTTGANASEQQQTTATPHTPDMTGVDAYQKSVAALQVGQMKPSGNVNKYREIGAGEGAPAQK